MLLRLVTWMLCWCALAHADPAPSPTPADDDATPTQLAARARVASRRGSCDEMATLVERVRTMDPDFYARELATDPAVPHCGDASFWNAARQPRPAPVAILAAETRPPSGPTRKSPGIALALSLGTPVAGAIMLGAASRLVTDRGTPGYTSYAILATLGATALIAGPSAGHVYAGHLWNNGLKWRLITATSVFAGAVLLDGCLQGSIDESGLWSCPSTAGHFFGGAMISVIVLGTLGHVGATVYEVADAPAAASRANAGLRVQVVPITAAGPGVSLLGTF